MLVNIPVSAENLSDRAASTAIDPSATSSLSQLLTPRRYSCKDKRSCGYSYMRKSEVVYGRGEGARLPYEPPISQASHWWHFRSITYVPGCRCHHLHSSILLHHYRAPSLATMSKARSDIRHLAEMNIGATIMRDNSSYTYDRGGALRLLNVAHPPKG